MAGDLHQLVREGLIDWQTGWSMGTFGAIAEFHQDRDEPAVIDDSYALKRATRRGGISLDHKMLDSVVPVAYETISPRPHRWSHAISLCLPEAEARREARSVLTELGPDDDAVRGIDRTGILFDMGLSLPQCDFCIRTSDPKLLGVLRAHLGRSLFEHDNPAMGAILSTHPHRVALTNLGRVEVYQKIGGPDTGGVSPPGPHTHVLPKLLRSGRTHSANTPIPENLLPVGALHPGNPVVGPLGEERTFDGTLHERFQRLFEHYGQRETVQLKESVLSALNSGRGPDGFEMPGDRFGRASMRLALRQQARIAEHERNDELATRVKSWRAAFDPVDDAADSDDEAPGH